MLNEIAFHLLLAAVTAFGFVATILFAIALWDWFRDYLSRRK